MAENNNGKSKLIYWLAGGLVGTIIIIYGIAMANISETKADLKIHESNQRVEQLEDARWKGSIDNNLSNIDGRLSNIEESLGIGKKINNDRK